MTPKISHVRVPSGKVFLVPVLSQLTQLLCLNTSNVEQELLQFIFPDVKYPDFRQAFDNEEIKKTAGISMVNEHAICTYIGIQFCDEVKMKILKVHLIESERSQQLSIQN